MKLKVNFKRSEVSCANEEDVYVSALVDLLLMKELDDIHQALVHLLKSDSVIDSDSQLVSQFLFDLDLKTKFQHYNYNFHYNTSVIRNQVSLNRIYLSRNGLQGFG